MSSVSRTFEVFSASISSWPGSEMCRGSVPWPYRTAGTLLSRRMRRAAPLPNSVRDSAVIRTSDTAGVLLVTTNRCGGQGCGARAGVLHVPDHRVDHGGRRASLAGQPRKSSRAPGDDPNFGSYAGQPAPRRSSAASPRTAAGSRPAALQGEGQLVELRPPPPADLRQAVAQLAELAEQLGTRPVGLGGQHVGDPVGLGQGAASADEHHPALVVQRVGLLGGRGLADPGPTTTAATLVPATRVSTWRPGPARRPGRGGCGARRGAAARPRRRRRGSPRPPRRRRCTVARVPGETGLASTYVPEKPVPATTVATSTAACGGSRLRTTSAPATRAAGSASP